MRNGNKNVAVLGAGLSGAAAALLLRSEGANVTVLDSAAEKDLLKSTLDNLRTQGVRILAGPASETDSTVYDFVVLSPGIDPASGLARNFSERNIEIIGELELGWRSCRLPVIAVTGTNGKTTTTELLAQMLNACGQRTIACGNIGKPLCEIVQRQQDFDVLTIEVSSFQLETIQAFHPEIAVWLNFAPDHLDRYRSVWEYREAKLRIFENQTEKDVAVINAGGKAAETSTHAASLSAPMPIRADFRLVEGAIVFQDEVVLRLADAKLRGAHNIENMMATLAAGQARGLSFAQMVPALLAYEPRPHRCEFVRKVAEVDYINDSKATNLDAVEKALQAQSRPVVLIAGGKDKGFNFEPLRSLVAKKVKCAVLIGEMAGAHRARLARRGALPVRQFVSRRGRKRPRRRERRRRRPVFSRHFFLRHV